MFKKFWIPTGEWPLDVEIYRDFYKKCGFKETLSQNNADFIILPGGSDIGARKNRDDYEINVIESSKINGTPLVAICRGMQLYLWLHGHKIITELENKDAILQHTCIEGEWTGNNSYHTTTSGLYVNSRHHQGFHIDSINNKKSVLQSTQDGIIEAYIDNWIFGVQWHPEHMQYDTKEWKWYLKTLNNFLKKHNNGLRKHK